MLPAPAAYCRFDIFDASNEGWIRRYSLSLCEHRVVCERWPQTQLSLTWKNQCVKGKLTDPQYIRVFLLFIYFLHKFRILSKCKIVIFPHREHQNSLFRQGSRGRITTLCLNRFIGFAPRLLGMLVELENSADHRIALKRIVTFYKEII